MKRGWIPLSARRVNPAAGPGSTGKPEWRVLPTWSDQLEKGELKFAAGDPDNPENFPRITSWRNLLGSLRPRARVLLPALWLAQMTRCPLLNSLKTVDPKPWCGASCGLGQVDLMMTVDFRNTTTTLMSDLVLPAATWYESGTCHRLTCTLHSRLRRRD